jgi:hypothetical protein
MQGSPPTAGCRRQGRREQSAFGKQCTIANAFATLILVSTTFWQTACFYCERGAEFKQNSIMFERGFGSHPSVIANGRESYRRASLAVQFFAAQPQRTRWGWPSRVWMIWCSYWKNE